MGAGQGQRSRFVAAVIKETSNVKAQRTQLPAYNRPCPDMRLLRQRLLLRADRKPVYRISGANPATHTPLLAVPAGSTLMIGSKPFIYANSKTKLRSQLFEGELMGMKSSPGLDLICMPLLGAVGMSN
jgi:hypothetical protein